MKQPDNLDLTQIFYLPLTIRDSIFFPPIVGLSADGEKIIDFPVLHSLRIRTEISLLCLLLHQNNSLHNIVHNGRKNKKRSYFAVAKLHLSTRE